MFRFWRPALASGCVLLAACAAASAHITLAVPQVTLGSTYRATFRVPHGCAGSPTTRLRIQIPEGVIAKPMPHPGWDLTTVTGPYQTPFTSEGVTLTEGTREVDWSGLLPDAYYDEFVIALTFTSGLKPDTVLYFPTVQDCQTGVVRWIEIPPDRKGPGDVAHPPPWLRLLAKP